MRGDLQSSFSSPLGSHHKCLCLFLLSENIIPAFLRLSEEQIMLLKWYGNLQSRPLGLDIRKSRFITLLVHLQSAFCHNQVTLQPQPVTNLVFAFKSLLLYTFHASEIIQYINFQNLFFIHNISSKMHPCFCLCQQVATCLMKYSEV